MSFFSREMHAGVLAVAALAATTACGPDPDALARNRIAAEYKDGRLAKLTYDRNGDGVPDTWGYMDGTHVLRVEVDENGDGKIDTWEFHKQGPGTEAPQSAEALLASPLKTVERVERSTKYDGKVTRREFFDDGVLAKAEEDTDADGIVDRWETYSAGELSVLLIDSDHRGFPNRRLTYRPDGVVTVEIDPDGSGNFRPAVAP